MLLFWYLRYIRRTTHDVPWIHLGVGAVGNLAFVVGSLMFLSPEWTRTGTWLFVVASWGMLVGVLGEIAARYEGRVRAREVSVAAGGG